MASLKIWNGSIVSIAKLEEVRVQVKGMPPKFRIVMMVMEGVILT